MAQRLKRLPAMQDTWVRSLGREDPLDKGKATHLSILAWRIPWTVQPTGSRESDTNEQLSLSLLSPTVKNVPAMQETWVRSLGQEDALEKGMATQSSILAWRIPEEPGGLQSMGLQRAGHD